jgi:hypothetical protein
MLEIVTCISREAVETDWRSAREGVLPEKLPVAQRVRKFTVMRLRISQNAENLLTS